MIQQIDTDLFLWINSHYNNFLDVVMWWASDRFIWIPLYIFLAIVFFKEFPQHWWKLFIAVGIMIVMTDQSANVFKEMYPRLRPCHDLNFQNTVHLVNGYCGGNFGFVSSHAANSVALTVFCFVMLGDKFRVLKYGLIIYALLICYSRIYLAAHFPFDVVRGILSGVIVAIIISSLTKILIKNKNTQ